MAAAVIKPQSFRYKVSMQYTLDVDWHQYY